MPNHTEDNGQCNQQEDKQNNQHCEQDMFLNPFFQRERRRKILLLKFDTFNIQGDCLRIVASFQAWFESKTIVVSEIGIINPFIPIKHGIASCLHFFLIKALEVSLSSFGKVGRFHSHTAGGPIFKDINWDITSLGEQKHLIGWVGARNITRMACRK